MNLRNSALKTKSQSRVSKPNFAKYFLPAALSLALAASSFLPAKAEKPVKVQDVKFTAVEICSGLNPKTNKFKQASVQTLDQSLITYLADQYPGEDTSVYAGGFKKDFETSESSLPLTDDNVIANIDLYQLQQAINQTDIKIDLKTAPALVIKLDQEGPKKMLRRGNVSYEELCTWYANAGHLSKEEAYSLILKAIKNGNYEVKRIQTTEKRDIFIYKFQTEKGTVIAADGDGWLELNPPGPDNIPGGMIITEGWLQAGVFDDIPLAFGRGLVVGKNEDQIFWIRGVSDMHNEGRDMIGYGPSDSLYNNLYLFKEKDKGLMVLNIDHRYNITLINFMINRFFSTYIKLQELLDNLLAAKF